MHIGQWTDREGGLQMVAWTTVQHRPGWPSRLIGLCTPNPGVGQSLPVRWMASLQQRRLHHYVITILPHPNREGQELFRKGRTGANADVHDRLGARRDFSVGWPGMWCLRHISFS